MVVDRSKLAPVATEGVFDELKRYVRFDADDEAALRAVAALVAPHFRRVTEEFYARLDEHSEARAVLNGPEQVERLKGTLVEWMRLLFSGPWDDAYYQRRARIGRMHVKIALPQRFMFGAMNLVRASLGEVIREQLAADAAQRERAQIALDKILDLELAIMLETYGEAFVEKVQQLERLEKSLLERRLAISEARYEEIVEKAEALIATMEPDGRILLFNRGCEEATGIRREDARGRGFLELFVAESDRQAAQAQIAGALAGRRSTPYEGPVASGAARRIVRWRFTTLPGTSGASVCAIGIDVTEEHDLSLRSRRAERLAALGTMAAGLAHEIRNPLNAAHLQLALLQRRIGRLEGAERDRAAEAAELAASEMRRLAALVEEFLSFAKPQPLRLARVDLRATADTIVTLLAPEAQAAGVDLSLSGEPTVVDIDDERIKQVILNLARNAIEATGRGGRVQIRVGRDGDSAILEVHDDGPGISSAESQIFEPFYTTKEKGTGLGLAIVHRIVTDHAGRVVVDSRPGRTVFRIALPLQSS
jgi:PAS domain S-box-containing protein